MIFISGIIVGILLSLVALIAGKRLDKAINEPHTVSHIKNSIIVPKAEIIKKEDPVIDFLNES